MAYLPLLRKIIVNFIKKEAKMKTSRLLTILSSSGKSPWLAGGVSPSSVVAAYQSLTSSYAASKINLANPSTHALTDGTTAPLWTAESGWDASNSGYLITDILPTGTMTVIFGYVGYTTAGARYAYGSTTGAGRYHTIQPRSATTTIRPFWGDYTTAVTGVANLEQNVIAVGPNFYWVNQTKFPITATWGDISGRTMYLLALNSAGNPTGPVAQGYWSAFYIYDPSPTDAQLLAIDNEIRNFF